MKIIKTTVLGVICAAMLIGTAHAEDAPLKGIKLGFGFDRGFGIVGSLGKFNGFLGDDGVAVGSSGLVIGTFAGTISGTPQVNGTVYYIDAVG